MIITMIKAMIKIVTKTKNGCVLVNDVIYFILIGYGKYIHAYNHSIV